MRERKRVSWAEVGKIAGRLGFRLKGGRSGKCLVASDGEGDACDDARVASVPSGAFGNAREAMLWLMGYDATDSIRRALRAEAAHHRRLLRSVAKQVADANALAVLANRVGVPAVAGLLNVSNRLKAIHVLATGRGIGKARAGAGAPGSDTVRAVLGLSPKVRRAKPKAAGTN